MSRFCTRCPTSRMKDGARHLHELPVGARFRFVGEPDAFVVTESDDSRTTIAPDRAESRAKVSFTTRFRGDVAFERPVRSERPCAGVAMVEQLS